MNASVTGMNAQSNYLTNVGQNMANSSTVGYKQADTEFSTLVNEAGVGQTSAGGVTTSTRLDIAKQGTLTGTSSSTDLAISGDGFFVVSDAWGQQYLTRSGSFVADKNGNLVNAGFTAPLLTRELMAAGFSSVAHLRRPASFDLWAVASKSPLAEPVLRQLAESHLPN
jgi:flagellar hook-basal body protein